MRVTTDRVLPAEAHAGDDRVLALRVRDVRVHDDSARHLRVAQAARRARGRGADDRRQPARRVPADRALAPPRAPASTASRSRTASPYRWMARRATVGLPPATGRASSSCVARSPFEDLSAHLAVRAPGAEGIAPVPRRRLDDGLLRRCPPATDTLWLEADRPLPRSAHPRRRPRPRAAAARSRSSTTTPRATPTSSASTRTASATAARCSRAR